MKRRVGTDDERPRVYPCPDLALLFTDFDASTRDAFVTRILIYAAQNFDWDSGYLSLFLVSKYFLQIVQSDTFKRALMERLTEVFFDIRERVRTCQIAPTPAGCYVNHWAPKFPPVPGLRLAETTSGTTRPRAWIENPRRYGVFLPRALVYRWIYHAFKTRPLHWDAIFGHPRVNETYLPRFRDTTSEEYRLVAKSPLYLSGIPLFMCRLFAVSQRTLLGTLQLLADVYCASDDLRVRRQRLDELTAVWLMFGMTTSLVSQDALVTEVWHEFAASLIYTGRQLGGAYALSPVPIKKAYSLDADIVRVSYLCVSV